MSDHDIQTGVPLAPGAQHDGVIEPVYRPGWTCLVWTAGIGIPWWLGVLWLLGIL